MKGKLCFVLTVCLIITALAVPSAQATIDLIDGSGLEWMFQTSVTGTTSSASGAVSEASYTTAVAATTSMGGTTTTTMTDAFDGYNALEVNGTVYTDHSEPTMECSGRQLIYPAQTIGNLSVSRKVFVPDNDEFARWMNIITNTGSAVEAVTVSTLNNLGSDSDTVTAETSDGDTAAEITDTWVVTHDNWQGDYDPRLGHILQGAGAAVSLSAISFIDGSDNPSWSYTFNLNPGETAIIMNFATGQPTIAAAIAQSNYLAALPANATQCMTEAEISQVVNFVTSNPEPEPEPGDEGIYAGKNFVGNTDGSNNDCFISTIMK